MDKRLLRRLARVTLKILRKQRGYKWYQKLSKKDFEIAQRIVKVAYFETIEERKRKNRRGTR